MIDIALKLEIIRACLKNYRTFVDNNDNCQEHKMIVMEKIKEEEKQLECLRKSHPDAFL